MFCLLFNCGHHLLCCCFKADSDLNLVYFYNLPLIQGINHSEGHLFLPVISQEDAIKAVLSTKCKKFVADDFNMPHIFISYRERRWQGAMPADSSE